MSVEDLKPHKKGDPKTGGKKKGYVSIKTILKRLAIAKIDIDKFYGEDDKEFIKLITKNKVLTVHEIIAIKTAMDAMMGQDKARNDYWNRIEGPVTEKMDIKHSNDKKTIEELKKLFETLK